ncbi:MAG: metal-dependent hydrolase [Pseudomonadota bacterium]
MDSLTQFTLGAAVTVALLGRNAGPRKAVLIGGLMGTLPDLDVFIPYEDPVDSFVLHRGATHSIFVHALATPVIGEALVRSVGALREHRVRVYATVFLVLASHAIIDAMTVYGTRIFWPVWPDPVGVGSIFIIDPLYTVPILIPVIWALCVRSWTARLARVLTIGLVFSTSYMALTVALQAYVEDRARTMFEQAGVEPTKVFALAAPFNTVLWKVIAIDEKHYHNLYLSLFDGDQNPSIYSHARRPDLLTCLDGAPAVQKLIWFSDGYLRAREADGQILVADLRMGLTPNYVFQFAVGREADGQIEAIPPTRYLASRRSEAGDWTWLLDRLWGRPAVRKVENGMAESSASVAAQC